MSTLTVNGSAVKKMTIKDSSGTEQKVKKWYHNDVKVFSSGNICTYYVNTNDVHSEEIDGDDSCLTPKTFTPSISGWTFVGWREDKVVSSTVLTSKTMGEDPVTLYAVFKKVSYVAGVYVTQWYNNGNWINPCIYVGTSSGTVVEYFNNGASIIPPRSFTPAISGWTFVGWRGDTTATSSVYGSYTMGTGIVTLYAVFRRTLTAYFNGNGATSGSVSSISAIQYYNNGNYANPTITLPGNGFAKTDYTFTGWNYGAIGAAVTLTSNITVYAQWVQSVYNYGYTEKVVSFTAPVAGTYQLEVWGGKGEDFDADDKYVYAGTGGYGGYATGRKYLSAGAVLYICTGGGNGNIYNGGGNTWNNKTKKGRGGGATHIATVNRGVLKNYKSTYTSEILLVAGGGGGASNHYDNSVGRHGGSGGGTNGGSAMGWEYNFSGQGGTQTAGGAGYPVGQFGQGGDAWSTPGFSDYMYEPGKGGGGLWGGGAGNGVESTETTGSGGGGSGYIGAVTNGSMRNGVNAGNGYAKITLL